MSRRWSVVIAVAVVAVALVFAFTFRTASPLADATVRFRAGEVFVGGRPFDGTIVRQGALVRTGADGRIDLDVAPSIAMEAGANTEFTVPLGSARLFHTSIVRGALRATAVGDALVLHAPHDVVTAVPATTLSIACDGESARVCVLRGSASAVATTIAAGTCVEMRNNEVVRRGEIPAPERLALEALQAASRLR